MVRVIITCILSIIPIGILIWALAALFNLIEYTHERLTVKQIIAISIPFAFLVGFIIFKLLGIS